MKKQMRSVYLVAFAALSASFMARADVLTFDPTEACSSTCANWDFIDQSYGDGVGVDVVWGDQSIGDAPGAQYWDDWGGLTNAVFVGVDDDESVGQIDIIALSGYIVTLSGFDLAAYASDRTSSWWIEDLDGNVLDSSGGTIDILFAAPTSVVGSYSSSTGIRIGWGPSAYNVGLDNLSFYATAVPEPGTLALFGLGLVVVGLRRRKR